MVDVLPDKPRIIGVNFRLERVQALNPARNGAHIGIDMGVPFWRATINTKLLDARLAGWFDALFTRLDGVINTVYVYNPARQWPIAYRGTFVQGVRASALNIFASSESPAALASAHDKPWGAPVVTTLNAAHNLILLEGLAANAALSMGDYFHWQDGPTRRLQMVVRDAFADANGATWVEVRPRPPDAATGILPIYAEFERASAEMLLVSRNLPFDTTGKWTAEFEAIQFLRSF